MSDFLNNLAAKSLSIADTLQPRMRSLFEPQSPNIDIPAQLSFNLSAETDAATEESSPKSAIENPRPSITILKQSVQPVSTIISSADAPAKQPKATDATPSQRIEPERSITIPERIFSAPKPSIDSPRQPAPDTNQMRVSADSQVHKPDRVESARQKTEDVPRVASLEPDIGRLVQEQINRIKTRLPIIAPRNETIAASQPAPDSVSRTIISEHTPPVIKPQVIQMPAPALPEIKITIGRVDVRAVLSTQPATHPRPAAAKPPATSLDEYLQKRSGGRR